MRSFTCTAAVMAVLLLSELSAAYNVRYTTTLSETGQMDFELPGACVANDPASHTMMPKTEAFQAKAEYAAKTASYSTPLPIGGEARQAACFDKQCTWQFNHGLYENNELTFFYGVYVDAELRGGPEEGVYNNFGHGKYPQYWSNGSYWGSRQPVMLPETGTWQNVAVQTYFREWVCETYEYTDSDTIFFPTYPNGEMIYKQNGPNGENYYLCGKAVKLDSQNRWINQRCEEPLEWWIPMVATVAAIVVIVFLIFCIGCCCCKCQRDRERRDREAKMRSILDNPGDIPTQTQIGHSRAAAAAVIESDVDDDEGDDGASYSRQSASREGDA